MVVYWFFVLLPALLALGQTRYQRRQGALLLAPLFVALFLFMALRETGGDFPTYLELYDRLNGAPLQIAVESVEPGYGFLNWASGMLGLGIYGVNAACAVIFLYCLYRVASKEHHPLLLVALAVPYFVIVVGMGYSRQGVAAALVMLAVSQLREGRPGRAAISVVLGSAFHFSAFAGMALPLLATTRHKKGVVRNVSRFLLLAVLVISSQFMFSNQIDAYTTHYVEMALYESGGAFLRSIVTGVAAAVFFLRRREFKKRYDDYGLWLPFAVLGLLSVPLSLVASTPVDRLGLYLIPFQLTTFSRLPMAFQDGRHFGIVRLLVLAAYLVYFFVWLHLGTYAVELWVPYRWIFSES